MGEGNEAIPVDRAEGKSVDPLGMMPCDSAKELVGRLSGLGPCADGEVNNGARQANGSLERLITARTRCPLLQQRSEKSGRGTSLVLEMGEVRATVDHHGGRYCSRKQERRRAGGGAARSCRPSVLDWVLNNGESLNVAIPELLVFL